MINTTAPVWKASLASRYEETVAWRRHLHRHPEVSYEERQTALFVKEKLESFGLETTAGVGGHGVVGRLKNGAGPVVALRADMDALPIQDEKTCEYASTVPGAMHACGHDAHTATLLSVARAMAEHREGWSGEVRFVFQPAEEVSPGGAQAMIKEGALQGVGRMYGVHLWTPIPSGIVAVRPGPMMAAVDDFYLTVYGRGGHGGMPHLCADAVVIGAQLVQQWQTIVSRTVSPLQPAVVSVGALQAGSTQNVIADRAVLKGTIRSFDPAVRELLRERFETILQHTCAMHGAEYELEYRVGYPALVNHESEAERVRRVAAGCFGAERVQEADMLMPAEDFAYYMKEVPGCFVLVGAGNGEAARYPHHHPRFDIDEPAMLTAGELLAGLACDALMNP
ncbi:amidohydrolase [Paenibacillus melissococcoides]|uniref:Amidohydrolase n=1 Tax=Paenibacillus melissococcoides TaxID=2912268 RepID=A0ABN8U7Z6_9BACL|nr:MULTISPECIES: amidohydrolase [Paenibacillus]MEB9897728.1 amidohydrolase [Bacillus cereus]CAH8247278.1 amidohydrolase [Paenibacillus melissococcoides]CAH8717235.1 amidohydrolase [Paenibacillus melissococcoides]CAH8718223.1 amidohydrolase [Paenibacillus melissococcoides]GIO77921.1 putative amidohydrolase YhaA [Paenibacillus dendritiformis]